MGRRYSFIVVILLLLTGMSWWSAKLNSSAPRASVAGKNFPGQIALETQRRDLLEAMDRVVSYQHYYRSVYGHFTQLLGRVGFSVPRKIEEQYDIRVTEASQDRLVLTAISEVEGQTQDRVSVNQEFRLQANFPIPPPRPEYLRAQALKHLRLLGESTATRVTELQSVYRDYFRFEIRTNSENNRSVSATGIRPPVLGQQLEWGGSTGLRTLAGGKDGEGPLLDEEVELSAAPGTGQKASGDLMNTLEEAYLAQRIFHGEVGRYAKDWSELSKIAGFRFEEKERYGGTSVPFGDREPASTESEAEDSTAASAGVSAEIPRTGSDELIVEPIPVN